MTNEAVGAPDAVERSAGSRGSSLRTLLLQTIRPYRRHFALIALFALLATGTDLLSPLIYREAVNDIAGLFVGNEGETGIDRLNMSEDATEIVTGTRREAHGEGYVAPRTARQALVTLLWSVTLLLGINVFSHFCMLMADQRTVRLASGIEADVIQRTFKHVLSLPLAFFSRRSSGSLAKQVDQSDKVAPIITALAQQIGPEVITMLGVMLIMLIQSWKLSLAALITLPPYVWIVLRSSRRLETGLNSYYEMWDGLSGRIQSVLGAVKTVKLSGAEAHESERLRKDSNAAYATYVARNRLANRYLFWQNSLSYFSQAIVLGYGGWLVFEKQLTPGDVVMFVVYLDKLYSPIESLTGLSVSLQEHFASLRRAARLVQIPGEETDGGAPPPGPGHVEFRNVHFSYLPGREVLHGVSFQLAAGRITALVGPSGAGKTTAADLMLRLYEPDSGLVLLDGMLLKQIAPASARREIAVVAADGAIFSGTLLDNIRYQRPAATVDEVRAAALAAGLANTLARLAEGLDAEIGERGVGLSVGERQRLQIARALVAQSRVMILDEATANLDYATEIDIRRTIFSPHSHPTTLVIAHRYSMVEHADHVIVMEAGRIRDQGTVADLKQRDEWFAGFAASTAATTAGRQLPAPAADDESDDVENSDD